jgi:hypothetical protein
MKELALTLSCILCFALTWATGQSQEADPYSVNLVQMALKTESQGLGIAKIQTNIARKGDQVSIALLNALNERDLTDPLTVERFLPLIRDSFAQPQFISIDVDRKPKVTLFLLKFLQGNVRDPQVQLDIKATIKFVNEKSTADSPSD